MNINKNLKSTKLFVIAAVIGCTIFGSGVANAENYIINEGETIINSGVIEATITNSGTIDGTGTVTTNGASANSGIISQHVINNTGTLTNNQSARLEITGNPWSTPADPNSVNTGSLTNDGIITGSGRLENSTNGTIRNHSGATISTVSLINSNTSYTYPPSIVNWGTINVSGVSNSGIIENLATLTSTSSLENQSGAFIINEGTLNVNNGTNNGTITLDLNNNTSNITVNGSFTNIGKITQGGLTISNNATLTNDTNAILRVYTSATNNGTLTNNSTTSATIKNITNNGTIDGTGSITLSGNSNTNSANATITQTRISLADSSDKLTNNGSINSSITNYGTIDGSGTINASGNSVNNGSISQALVNNSGTFTNNANKTITLSSITANSTNTGTFHNYGTITGSRDWGTKFENKNVFNNNSGATLSTTSFYNSSSSSTTINNGTINVAGVNNVGTINNIGTLTSTSSLSNESNATINNSGNLNVYGGSNAGTIQGYNETKGSFTIAQGGEFNNNGTISQDTLTNNGTLKNNGTSSLAEGKNYFYNNSTGNIENEGTIGGQTVYNYGSITNKDTSSKLAGWSITNSGSITNNGTVQSGSLTNNSGKTITNYGTITSSESLSNSGTINSSGTISANNLTNNNRIDGITSGGTTTYGTLTASGTSSNSSIIKQNIVKNTGTFTNYSGAQIELYGDDSSTNTGTFNNSGSITGTKFDNKNIFNNNSGATLSTNSFYNSVASAVATNNGTINVIGVQNYGTINNIGTLTSTSSLSNESNAYINNSGSLTVLNGYNRGTIQGYNGSNGSFSIAQGGSYTNDGSLTQGALTINNNATLTNNEEKTLSITTSATNNGTIVNNSTLASINNLTNNTTINGTGNLALTGNGNLNNEGATINQGKVTISGTSDRLGNAGIINSAIVNNGTIGGKLFADQAPIYGIINASGESVNNGKIIQKIINNTGTFTNNSEMTINGQPWTGEDSTTSGTFINNGTIDGGARLLNEGEVINNVGAKINTTSFHLTSTNATATNKGLIDVLGFDNNGTITNTKGTGDNGTIKFTEGHNYGTIQGDGSLVIKEKVNTSDSYTNLGSITQSDITLSTGTLLTNEVNKTITLSDKIDNNGTVQNKGIISSVNFINTTTGIIENTNKLTVSDTLTNNNLINSKQKNDGSNSIITTGTLQNNNGTINMNGTDLSVIAQKSNEAISGTINVSNENITTNTNNSISFIGENGKENTYTGLLKVILSNDDSKPQTVLDIIAGDIIGQSEIDAGSVVTLKNDGSSLQGKLTIDSGDKLAGDINIDGGKLTINNLDNITVGDTNTTKDSELPYISMKTNEVGSINSTLVLQDTSMTMLDSSKISGGNLIINDGSIYNSVKNAFTTDNLTTSGLINANNYDYETYSINKDFNIGSTTDNQADFNIDVYGRSNTNNNSDKFLAGGNLTTDLASAKVNVANWQLQGDLFGKDAPIDKVINLGQIFDGSSIDSNIDFTASDKKVMTAVGNYQMRSMGSGAYSLVLTDYNPKIFRGQTSTLAMYANQINIDDIITQHFIMHDPQAVYSATEISNSNKYAINDSIYTPYHSNSLEEGGLWFKNYVDFERLSMTQGLNVHNTAYGSIVGADLPLVNLKRNWKFIPTVYIAYNGANQSYGGMSMYQNGGQGGAMATFLKNDFTASILAYGGGYHNEMNLDGHTDRTGNWFAGAASRFAYNLHATKHFTVQPMLFASYNIFGKQKWNSDYGAMSMNSGYLNGINVAPGINFIYTRETWSAYATFQYTYNINDQVSGRAGNIDLPTLEMRHGYLQYGVGLTKTWKDRLKSYVQIVLRNGGRTGIGFQLGFRYAFGKDKETVDKVQKNNSINEPQVKTSNKTIKQLSRKDNTSLSKNI